MQVPRARIRLLEGVEKARKMLSSVSDAQINIEYLHNEEDLNRTIKKDEFEKLIDPHLRRFAALLKATIAASGYNTDKIHSVEMFGDATRTPIILDITKQMFNKKETSRTMNSLDTIAKGASLQAAILNYNFRIDYVIEEYNPLPVNLQYQFHGAELKENAIFPIGSMYPLTKSISFKKKLGNMDLLLKYGDKANILPGLPIEIARYQIMEGVTQKQDMPDYSLKF